MLCERRARFRPGRTVAIEVVSLARCRQILELSLLRHLHYVGLLPLFYGSRPSSSSRALDCSQCKRTHARCNIESASAAATRADGDHDVLCCSRQSNSIITDSCALAQLCSSDIHAPPRHQTTTQLTTHSPYSQHSPYLIHPRGRSQQNPIQRTRGGTVNCCGGITGARSEI